MAKRLRYFYEFKLVEDAEGRHKYIPIGVWAHDPATNDLNIAFLPEYWEEEFEATQPLNGLVEENQPVPPDFFDFWQEHISSYRGQRGPIQETDRFENVVRLTDWLLDEMKAGRFHVRT
jgi:hypothetical protein